MAINASVQHNGGFCLRYYTVDPMLLPSGNPFKYHEEVLYLQPMIPPKRFDIFPPDWGVLRRSRCVQIFLKKKIRYLVTGFEDTRGAIVIVLVLKQVMK